MPWQNQGGSYFCSKETTMKMLTTTLAIVGALAIGLVSNQALACGGHGHYGKGKGHGKEGKAKGKSRG